jgi:hypothetical protein
MKGADGITMILQPDGLLNTVPGTRQCFCSRHSHPHSTDPHTQRLLALLALYPPPAQDVMQLGASCWRSQLPALCWGASPRST